jgi:hypothetical protein
MAGQCRSDGAEDGFLGVKAVSTGVAVGMRTATTTHAGGVIVSSSSARSGAGLLEEEQAQTWQTTGYDCYWIVSGP